MKKTEQQATKRRKKRQDVEAKILKKNIKGAEIVKTTKPEIHLNIQKQVVAVVLNGMVLSKNEWREHLPNDRYDINFVKIK